MRKVFLGFLFLVVSTPLSAVACSCVESAFSREGSTANIEGAALIFKGRVKNLQGPPPTSTGLSPDQNSIFSKATLEIQDIYKGQNTKEVTAYFDTVTSCGSQVKEGDGGLYILNEHKGVLVLADLCGKYIAPEHMKKLKSGGYLKAAQEISKDVPPEDIEAIPFIQKFESEEAMRQWAKSATFGGGYVEKRALFGKNLALVFRSYTSGIPSFDVGIYQQNVNEWRLIKSHVPVLFDQPLVRIVDDYLTILTLKGGEEILSVGEQDLNQNSP